MPTIDTNTLTVRAIEETTFGTTPIVGNLQVMRITSAALAPAKETITSNIIRTDASVDSILRTLISQGGGLPIEVVYGTEFETLLTGLMRSTITQAFVLGTITSAIDTPAVGQVTLTGTATTFLTTLTADAVGSMVRFFDNSVSIGVGKIESITETVIVVTDANSSFSNVTGGGDEQVDVRYIRNGTTLKSYTVELEVIDDSASPLTYFQRSTGARVSGLNLSISAQGLLTGEWLFTGLDHDSAAVSVESLGPTVVLAGTTKPLSASGDVNEVWEGDVFNNCVTDLSFSISNNARLKAVIGQLTPKGIGFGRFTPTGNITFLKDTNLLLDKLHDHTGSSLDIFGTDQAGNVIVISAPQIVYTDGGDNMAGADSDVEFSSAWGAERDPNLGTAGGMMQFSLLPAVPLV